MILFGVINLVSLQSQYRRAADEYEDLRQNFTDRTADGGGTVEKGEDTEDGLPEAPELQVDLEALQEENPDTVGWLYYPACGIDYPVMQDSDNGYYIDHTYQGDRNAVGSIFMDAYNSAGLTDRNTFLYGHNMRNGEMFGRLKEIREEGVVSANPYIWLYTADGWQCYEIFSYHDAGTDDSSFLIRFEDDEDFLAYVDHVRAMSEAELAVEISAEDSVLTLSTCTGDSSVRFLVHAVLRTK